MNIYVSNLAFQGLGCGKMKYLPENVGIEVFCETGNDYYWNHLLPELLENHRAPLSIHGPFQRLDLSDPYADFDEQKAAYIWAFELGKKFGAEDCVCHPYHGKRPENDTKEASTRAKQTSLERILELNRISNEYGIELLVENMPETDGLLDEQGFIDLFEPHDELNFLIDVGHAHLQKWDMDYALGRLGNRIKGYHLSDNAGDFDSHLKVGEGSIEWDAFFRTAIKHTPDAKIVLEYNFGPLENVVNSINLVDNLICAQAQ